MPSCTCPGLCGGDPSWRDFHGLPCTVCHGSGVYDTPPSFREKMESEARAKGRLTHSAIVSGDQAWSDVERRKRRRSSRPAWPRKRRRTKVEKAQARRSEESARLDAEAAVFRATRMPDPKALDELKVQWRKEQDDSRRRGRS
jgi:hypothetical protein